MLCLCSLHFSEVKTAVPLRVYKALKADSRVASGMGRRHRENDSVDFESHGEILNLG